MNPRPRPPRPRSPQRRQQRPRIGWPARLFRRWRPDRNPLRRSWDRAETAVFGALLAAFLAGAPFAAFAAGGWAYTVAAAEARTQQVTVHSVPATLLESVPSLSAYADGAAGFPDANARWRAPDGQVRTGLVYAPDGGTAGSTVTIWVTRSGQQVNPPLRPAQVTDRGQLAAELAVAALALTLVIAGALARRVLDARRLAGWDADWLATGPRWAPRR